jgi:hypothetical protein
MIVNFLESPIPTELSVAEDKQISFDKAEMVYNIKVKFFFPNKVNSLSLLNQLYRKRK